MPWGRGSTRASRTTRAQVLLRDQVCTCPGCPACSPDGCGRPATDDDHIVPFSQGGSDELANRRGLCGPCHDDKSQREAAAARALQMQKLTRPKPKHPGLR